MAGKRGRTPVSEALSTFTVQRQGVRVDPGAHAGPLAAALARTAVELAAAQAGAAVILTRERAAGAALRGARELGAEPRVISAKVSGLLSARTPLSLGLQGERKSAAFAGVASFVGDYLAARVAAAGSAPGQTSAKVRSGLGKARDAAKAALDFEAARPSVQAMFSATDPLRKPVAEALADLERAEAAARALRVPVSWSTLAAPSAAGRRAAVYLDLAPLPPSAREDVLALTLAALAASEGAVAQALGGGPLVVVADHPATPLGRFAAQRLVAPTADPALPALVMLLAHDGDAEETAFPLSAFDGTTFALPAGPPLPLAPAPEPSDPLEDAEARALTPPPLRARILGEGGAAIGDEEPDGEKPEANPDPRADESLTALRDATGDLEALARRSAKAGARPRPRKEGNYEASDFEL